MDEPSEYERLRFIVVIFPNIGVFLFALLFTPFMYLTSYGSVNMAQLLNVQELRATVIFNLIFVMIFYLLIPFLIDHFRNWVKGSLDESLRIHTDFLESVNVPKQASVNVFLKRVRDRIFRVFNTCWTDFTVNQYRNSILRN